MEKRLYNVIEVSKMLGIGKAKVYELIKSGQLPALKLGGLKVRSEAIDELLNKLQN
ncbi:MAG: helix-turn-helix domain-containing protein [Clostridia bacterium]|nr:helix-turn-helix domain-containing protein [Clostridia bacterium]